MKKFNKKVRVVNMPEGKTIKTSMRLPEHLWILTRILAIKRRVDAQDIVTDALGLYFKSGKGGAK